MVSKSPVFYQFKRAVPKLLEGPTQFPSQPVRGTAESGAHSLVFGAEYRRIEHNDINTQSIRRIYQFSSLDGFLAAGTLSLLL